MTDGIMEGEAYVSEHHEDFVVEPTHVEEGLVWYKFLELPVGVGFKIGEGSRNIEPSVVFKEAFRLQDSDRSD